jgi:hypothetical protein
MKDLFVLVADGNMKSGIGSLLGRKESLGIRQISYNIGVHEQGHDPGIYKGAVDYLREFLNQYSYALVFLDYEGSGQEKKKPLKIASEIKGKLERNGWKDRVEVIVFEPEFDIWVWAESQNTAKVIGWSDYSLLRNWLISKGFWEEDELKPLKRPKEALEAALEEKNLKPGKKGIPRSSSIYSDIAREASLHRCKEPSFLKFKDILQKWFPKHED